MGLPPLNRTTKCLFQTLVSSNQASCLFSVIDHRCTPCRTSFQIPLSFEEQERVSGTFFYLSPSSKTRTQTETRYAPDTSVLARRVHFLCYILVTFCTPSLVNGILSLGNAHGHSECSRNIEINPGYPSVLYQTFGSVRQIA